MDLSRLTPPCFQVSRELRAAISALFAVILIIVIFVGGLFERSFAVATVILFVPCMTALIVSLTLFIRDINLSLNALLPGIGPVGRHAT